MASAFETVAAELKTIIDTEFAAEGITAIKDNLHESLGRTRAEVGIAPVEDVVTDRNANVQETIVEVRFYDLWVQEISPSTMVDPSKIAGYAERFRNAVRVSQLGAAGTGRMWYFDVRRIAYPSDPTGNKTRFHATLRAYGNNSGLVETTG
jgi:hypothetical protein